MSDCLHVGVAPGYPFVSDRKLVVRGGWSTVWQICMPSFVKSDEACDCRPNLEPLRPRRTNDVKC